jgi:hypothetical protein
MNRNKKALRQFAAGESATSHTARIFALPLQSGAELVPVELPLQRTVEGSSELADAMPAMSENPASRL